MTEPAPVVGAVYVVGEDDYRFGLGALRVTVDEVIEKVYFGESGRVDAWWHVRAHTTSATDTYAWSGSSREIYLRASALRRTC